jgi:hypothetical protein
LWDLARGPGPKALFDAFNTLSTPQPSPINDRAALLSYIRQIFTQSGATRVSSKQLLDSLRALPDRPWVSALRTPKSGADWLALRLRLFCVTPCTMRIGEHLVKGYDLANFTEPFTRFLNGDSSFPR